MIAEMRAVQVDLAARVPFTAEKEPVIETRAVLDKYLNPEPERAHLHVVEKTAAALAAATQGGFVEVG